jgi:hypothetical protein
VTLAEFLCGQCNDYRSYKFQLVVPQQESAMAGCAFVRSKSTSADIARTLMTYVREDKGYRVPYISRSISISAVLASFLRIGSAIRF